MTTFQYTSAVSDPISEIVWLLFTICDLGIESIPNFGEKKDWVTRSMLVPLESEPRTSKYISVELNRHHLSFIRYLQICNLGDTTDPIWKVEVELYVGYKLHLNTVGSLLSTSQYPSLESEALSMTIWYYLESVHWAHNRPPFWGGRMELQAGS
jgi:hypothetical protein